MLEVDLSCLFYTIHTGAGNVHENRYLHLNTDVAGWMLTAVLGAVQLQVYDASHFHCATYVGSIPTQSC